MENRSNGSSFLRVCGILMIIGAILSLVFAVIAVIVIRQPGSGLNTPIHWVSVVLAFVGSAIELIAGILGVRYADRPEKAKTCIVCGVLVILMTLLSQVISAVSGGEVNFLNALTGLLVPILYVIGAFKNQRA